ncbi:hypothetical protein EB796_024711 [Bugula neritina]|uniref:Kinesin motor domain-containing protein n=1 Tax=Bugula neritina TaxID=10212 RepID=A0A7J7IT02_BUGNE|nr:hypothetical protein EB796_024711 [Bugula neritina]
MAQQIVAVRIRPLVERFRNKSWSSRLLGLELNSYFRKDVSDSLPFVFDHVIGKEEINRDVYNVFGKDIVTGAVKGINGTIFAYGQTSSGKTHTMLGSDAEPGLISYAMNDIFSLVQLATERCFLISLSYNEIYNEEVHDLLTGATNLKIRENEVTAHTFFYFLSGGT